MRLLKSENLSELILQFLINIWTVFRGIMSELFNEIKESLTMQQVAEHFGYKVNRSGFILSPFGNEKTPSCKLYRNSYYDFSTAAGGDLIQFTAAINGSNNWQACQYLIEAFSLPYSYQVTQITGNKYAAGSRSGRSSRNDNKSLKRVFSGK